MLEKMCNQSKKILIWISIIIIVVYLMIMNILHMQSITKSKSCTDIVNIVKKEDVIKEPITKKEADVKKVLDEEKEYQQNLDIILNMSDEEITKKYYSSLLDEDNEFDDLFISATNKNERLSKLYYKIRNLQAVYEKDQDVIIHRLIDKNPNLNFATLGIEDIEDFDNILSQLSYEEKKILTSDTIYSPEYKKNDIINYFKTRLWIAIHEEKFNWSVREEISDFDDGKNVVISTDAEDNISTRYNESYRPSIYIRCAENETDAYINWGMFITTGDANITLRFDKNKMSHRSWNTSTNYKATFVPNAISFIKKLLKHNQLLVEVTPHGDNPVSVKFDLRGLDKVIYPLRESCNW